MNPRISCPTITSMFLFSSYIHDVVLQPNINMKIMFLNIASWNDIIVLVSWCVDLMVSLQELNPHRYLVTSLETWSGFNMENNRFWALTGRFITITGNSPLVSTLISNFEELADSGRAYDKLALSHKMLKTFNPWPCCTCQNFSRSLSELWKACSYKRKLNYSW